MEVKGNYIVQFCQYKNGWIRIMPFLNINGQTEKFKTIAYFKSMMIAGTG